MAQARMELATPAFSVAGNGEPNRLVASSARQRAAQSGTQDGPADPRETTSFCAEFGEAAPVVRDASSDHGHRYEPRFDELSPDQRSGRWLRGVSMAGAGQADRPWIGDRSA